MEAKIKPATDKRILRFMNGKVRHNFKDDELKSCRGPTSDDFEDFLS